MAKPGRPKGTGRGLVLLNTRVEPDVYDGLESWRERQIDRETGEPISQADAVRRLLRWALEQVGSVKELDEVSKGYMEGVRRGRADFHRALDETWARLRQE